MQRVELGIDGLVAGGDSCVKGNSHGSVFLRTATVYLIVASTFKMEEEHLARKKMKRQWGGARPGAGRPVVVEDPQGLSLWAQGKDMAELKQLAGRKEQGLSEYVRRVLHQHIVRTR